MKGVRPTTELQPRVGDIFVVRTGGWVGSAIRLVTRSRVNHAGVVVGLGIVNLRPRRIRTIEAEPRGTIYARLPRNCYLIRLPLTADQRAQVPVVAAPLIGRGYSFLGCLVVGLAQYGIRIPWLLRSTRRLFCSQEADLIAELVGFHLFADRRPTGDVSPGDLLQLAEQHAGRDGWELHYTGREDVRP